MPSITKTAYVTDYLLCPVCGENHGCYVLNDGTIQCGRPDNADLPLKREGKRVWRQHQYGTPCPCGKQHTVPDAWEETLWYESPPIIPFPAGQNRNGSTATPDEGDDDDAEVRTPITRAVRPWPVLGEAALHGLAGNVVRTIEPSNEADPVGILVSFLLAFGSMVGRKAYVTVGSVRHYANEYALLVGDTSKSRKGSATSAVRVLMGLVERYWSLNCTSGGLSTGEGLIHAVRDPSTGTDKAGNEVTTDNGVLDKRLFLVQEEFASVLAVSGRDKNTLSEMVREAWDGREVLRNLNKNSPERATGAHISLLGHITLDELRKHLTETETANGFANRFLFAVVRRSKELPFGGYADLESLAEPIAQALEYTHSLVDPAARGEGTITWADATRPLWKDVYGPLSAPRRGLVGALTARSEAHVLRLAMIYALLDRSHLILPKHLGAALALWRYCEDSCTHIFGDSLGDGIASGILTLLEMMGAEGADRSAITRHFGNNLSASRLEAALHLLLEHGSIMEYEVRGKGRPRRVYVRVTV